MRFEAFCVISCMLLAITACSDTDKHKTEHEAVEYVPDPNQIYTKVVGDRPVDISLLPQDTEHCFLDVINNQSATGINVLTGKSKVYMSGWAGDVPNGKSPQEVWIELDGIKQDTGFYYIKTASGIKRQDVADVFKKPGLVDTGWEVFVDLSEMAGGIYDVHIVMLVESKWMTCDTKRVIQI